MFTRKSPPEAAAHLPAKPGGKSDGPKGVPDEAAQKQIVQALRQSVSFAQIVSLLMRSPLYRHFAIADLEWFVIPPLATGMFALAEARAQASGPAFPAAAVLWGSVSRDVSSRLAANLNAPIRLRPDEWRSGEILWVIAGIGDPRVVTGLLKQLAASTFKGRDVHIRATASDGKPAVKLLSEIFSADEAA
jgi:hemolysin-activating ACP:hemolysin acyltransferase